jgi:hypothetical protein
VAQKRGTKILQVPNPADALKVRNGEISVQKARFVLLRLLSQEAGNPGLKDLQSLVASSLNLIIRRTKSSRQVVCKMIKEIHH